MCRILSTGGGGEIIDNPCAVGGTPVNAGVFLPPDPERAVERSTCSIAPVEVCISAFPFNEAPGAPPVLYFTPQRYVEPPKAQMS